MVRMRALSSCRSSSATSITASNSRASAPLPILSDPSTSMCRAISAGWRISPASTARASIGSSPAAWTPLATMPTAARAASTCPSSSRRAGGTRGAGRRTARRSGGGTLRDIPGARRLGDRLGELGEAAAQPRARLGRVERLGGGFVRPDAVGELLRLAEQRLERRGALGADEIVGVHPLGQRDEGEAGARARGRAGRGARRGSPPSAPRRRPSKQSKGTSASRHSRAIWCSVSAVPSGATASPNPAWASAITSI